MAVYTSSWTKIIIAGRQMTVRKDRDREVLRETEAEDECCDD